jgi:iron complex outermembrane receptor protein
MAIRLRSLSRSRCVAPRLRAPRRRLAPVTAAVAALLPLAALAQDDVQRVTVTGGAASAPVAVGGFGDVPPSQLPMSAGSVDAARLVDAGATQLADLTRFDAAVGDAYNAEGYWSILSVRGYVLDNRFNYRRDGLPINAETALPLAHLERIEVLRGTSGIQAGTSAPGGLVNLVVKRPVSDLRQVRVEARDGGGFGAAVDLSQRFGAARDAGLRLNVAVDRLDPPTRDAQGERHVVALAGDWRAAPGSRLEAEFDVFRQRQPSVPGFSLLGDTVPSPNAIDPRTNLNSQPWTLPVVFDGRTASLRWTQDLPANWRFVAHGMAQRLTTDDRTAFPYGVYDADYTCTYCDRFAPNGDFSVWEFVSDNERRRSDALDLHVEGAATTGAWRHALTAGVLLTRYRARFEDQIFDVAGLSNVFAPVVVPPSAGWTDTNTDRHERSTEFYLRDRIDVAPGWQLWAGLRHTRLARDSVRTDGSAATSYSQSATLPWLALSHRPTPTQTWYASWGQGLESEVVPNRPRYTNAGEALPALKSRQVELGWKWRTAALGAEVALFDIARPVAEDFGDCDGVATCTRRIDGDARHRGVEAQFDATTGRWDWRASALWLDATREGSALPGVNGTRPNNVPELSLRAGLTYRPSVVEGLALSGDVVHEGSRELRLVGDPAVYRIAGWTRVDAAARWVQRTGGTTLTWRIGVDNVFDRRAWREAPVLFGHAWLFPLEARTWRASLQAAF